MILVVDSDEAVVMRCRMRLYRLGLLSEGAGFRSSYDRLQKQSYDVLILPRPTAPGRPPHYCQNTHRRYPSLPIVMAADHSFDGQEIADPGDLVIRAPYSPVSFVRKMIAFLVRSGNRNIGDCIAGGLRDRIEYPHLFLFGYPIIFTKTERSILRILILNYPQPIAPTDLARQSAKPGNAAKLGNLSPHICRINRKASELIGRPLVCYHPKTGYIIHTKKEDIS